MPEGGYRMGMVTNRLHYLLHQTVGWQLEESWLHTWF